MAKLTRLSLLLLSFAAACAPPKPPEAMLEGGIEQEHCDDDAFMVRVQLANPAWLRDGGAYVLPEVLLRSDAGVELQGDAASDAPRETDIRLARMVIKASFAPKEPLPTGIYALVLRRFDGREEVLASAVELLHRPLITAIRGGERCGSLDDDLHLTIESADMSPDLSLRLSEDGDPRPLQILDATTATLTLPVDTLSKTPGTFADVYIGRGACQTRVEKALRIVEPATLGEAIARPQHFASNAIAADARVRVRFDGHLSHAQKDADGQLSFFGTFRIGDVAATHVRFSPKGSAYPYEAEFPPNALAGGEGVPLSYDVPGCAVVQTTSTFDLLKNANHVQGISPNGLKFDAVNFIDLRTDSRDTAMEVFVSRESDVFAENRSWLGTQKIYPLDALRMAARRKLGGSVSLGVIDLALRTSEGLTYVSDAFRATEEGPAIARFRDMDSAMVTNPTSFTVWGCGLARVAEFLLVRESDGLRVPLGVVPDSLNTADAWAANSFLCNLQDVATDRVSLSIPKLEQDHAGSYRLMLVTGDGLVHEDTYPFDLLTEDSMLKTAAGTPGSEPYRMPGSTADAMLFVGRRGPAATVATDALGRKYVYVFGGDRNASVSPVSVYDPQSMYEFAPIGRGHELLPFKQAELQDENDILFATFGLNAIGFGPDVYLLGGTQAGTLPSTEKRVLKARVTSADASGALEQFRPSAVTLPKPTFGAQASLVVEAERRRIVVLGGYTVESGVSTLSNQLLEIAIGPTGMASSITTPAAQANVRPQAFGAMLATNPATLHSLFGVTNAFSCDQDDDTSTPAVATCRLLDQVITSSAGQIADVASHAVLTPATAMSNDILYSAPLFGMGAVLLGTHAFTFGGASGEVQSPNLAPRSDFFSLPLQAQALRGAKLTAHLPMAHMYFATLTLGAQVYTFGGLTSEPTNVILHARWSR